MIDLQALVDCFDRYNLVVNDANGVRMSRYTKGVDPVHAPKKRDKLLKTARDTLVQELHDLGVMVSVESDADGR